MFETERLGITQAQEEDCQAMLSIGQSWDNQQILTGNEPANIDYFIQGLKIGHLPPSGRKENYCLLAIRRKSDGKIVGTLEIYQGYPDEKTLWLGQLVIDKKLRSQGFGQEVVDGLKSWSISNEFEKVQIGVHLKNWSALKFWVANGFDKINRISGDAEYSDRSFAVIALEWKNSTENDLL